MKGFLALFSSLLLCVVMSIGGIADARSGRGKKRLQKPAGSSKLFFDDGRPTPRLTRQVLKGSIETDLGLMRASNAASLPDTESIVSATAAGKLATISEHDAYIFSPHFAQLHADGKERFRVALPQVRRFVELFVVNDLYAKFKVKFQFESLVRSEKDQAALRRRPGGRVNRYAAKKSAHTFGGAVDIAMQLGDGTNTYLPINIRDYIRERLTLIELVDVNGNEVTAATPMADRQIQATEERVCPKRGKNRGTCFGRAFHVVVGPKFGLKPVAYARAATIAQK